MLCSSHFTYIISIPTTPYEVGPIIIPILLRTKLRPTETN